MKMVETENSDDSNECKLSNENFQSADDSPKKSERSVSTKDVEDFIVHLKKVKIEPETAVNMPLNGEDKLSAVENFKLPETEPSTAIKREFSEATDKDLPGVEEMVETEHDIDSSEVKETNENELLKMFKEDTGFLNNFHIKIPLIGKRKFKSEMHPLARRYDLAIERNKTRFAYMKETGIDDEVLRMIDKEASMSENDKKNKTPRDECGNINTACLVTELCIKMLEELNSNHMDEKKMMRYLLRVFYSNITADSLLYVPHLVHTICFIRGNKAYSKKLRLAADECYKKFHGMFSIPPDSNFETVYNSEMTKFLPKDFKKFENCPLDYGDLSDILKNSSCD